MLLVLSFSYSVKSQYSISRSQISFYVDGDKKTKEQSDSIIVLVQQNNNIKMLEDSLLCFEESDSVYISLHFVIEGRVISFKNILAITNYERFPVRYEFRYTHIESLIPITKENIEKSGFEWKDFSKYKKHYYLEPITHNMWYLPLVQLGSNVISSKAIYYGVARLENNISPFNSFYRCLDYRLGHDSERLNSMGKIPFDR